MPVIMKPLLKNDLNGFLSRFDNFKDSQVRNLEIISPTAIKITLATQDSARGYDWLTIAFEFSNVSSADLLDNSKLKYIDISSGISISNNGTHFAFKILDSTFFIECLSIKYQEGAF